VSFVTAIVFTVVLAETDGFPTDVAVTVAVLISPSFAVVGTVTLTQTFVVSPGATVGVVVIVDVHVESRKLTVYVPPELDSEYESLVNPVFVTPIV
jgi:hypothetical protein